MKNFLILLSLAVFTMALPRATIAAGSADAWARQLLIPDARILWSQETAFSECFSMGNDQQWHHCGDRKRPLPEEYVTKKVGIEYSFKVPVAGKLYAVLEAHIDKDAWLYKHVKLFLYKYDKTKGKWIDVNIRTYSALFKGEALLYERPEARKIQRGETPVNYISNADGSITLSDQFPIYEPGDYKILLSAADRGPTVYLPSQAKAAVYIIPEDPSTFPDKPPAGPLPALPPTSSGKPLPKPGTSLGISSPELTKIDLQPCSKFKGWCYNGGGQLTFDDGFIELVPINGCSLRLVLQGVSGTTLQGASPPYRFQMFARTDQGGTVMGEPFKTDSSGSYSGIIGPCPNGHVFGFVINSPGNDGSFRTYHTGARQQFASKNYYGGKQVIWSGSAGQGSSPALVGSLAGVWKMTCVATGITYKFDLHLKQSNERITGHMIRTNGQEINTKVEGRVLPDGRLDFTRSAGAWRQHYIGKVTEVSGDMAVRLSGRFGDPGQEKFDWNAQKFK
jgi:hypothetical protein